MELPTIGNHCASVNCKQLDFLPLQCHCTKVFCSDHFNSHVVECASSRYLAKEELKKIENVFICSHPGCKERSVVPLICEKCKKHLCVTHRHLTECKEKDSEVLAAEKEKYNAPVRQFMEAKIVVDKQVENVLSEAKKNPKNKEMACKVQLMRIKNKATGLKTVPVVNRVYFNIKHPVSTTEKITPVFVSNQWTVGRAIDAIAQECHLQNNNHKSTEKKLRLFKENNTILENLSVTLNSLLDNKIIVNGENLLIEYVDDSCKHL